MSHSKDYLRRARTAAGSALVLFAMACFATAPQWAAAADKPKGQEISRTIAKEMTAAQKAMQASQWNEAIKNLDAAEAKSPLTSFDKKTIEDFKGFAYLRLNNMKSAQTAYEAALATGAYSSEDVAKTNRILFRLAAGNQQYAKAIEYGKQSSDSGAASADDLGVMAQLYYLQKDCKSSAVWGDKAIAAAR